MKVQIEKTFPMPASADTTWALLQDIESVAACMPGARITERIDAQHYKGTVSVKFGPASMSFRGEVEVKNIDPATRTLRLLGKGTDSTGSSGAAMDLTARVVAAESAGAAESSTAAACNLVGVSEVSMSGKAATFGGRMMGTVADQVLKQFAANFANQVQALQAGQPAPSASPAASPAASPTAAAALGAAADSSSNTTAAAASNTIATAATSPLPMASAAVPVSPEAAATPSPALVLPAPAQSELNGLALLWAIISDWFRNLLSAKKA